MSKSNKFLKNIRELAEKDAIITLLTFFKGNLVHAADSINIDRRNFHRLIKKHKLIEELQSLRGLK